MQKSHTLLNNKRWQPFRRSIAIATMLFFSSTCSSTTILDSLSKTPVSILAAKFGQPKRATVGSAGGQIKTNLLQMNIPPGALSSTKAITVTASTKQFPPRVIAAYEFGPDGTQFNKPITVTMKYDPALIPAGMREANLFMATSSDGKKFEPLPSRVNMADKTITGEVRHFSWVAGIESDTPVDVPPPGQTGEQPVLPVVDDSSSSPVSPPEVPAAGSDSSELPPNSNLAPPSDIVDLPNVCQEYTFSLRKGEYKAFKFVSHSPQDYLGDHAGVKGEIKASQGKIAYVSSIGSPQKPGSSGIDSGTIKGGDSAKKIEMAFFAFAPPKNSTFYFVVYAYSDSTFSFNLGPYQGQFRDSKTHCDGGSASVNPPLPPESGKCGLSDMKFVQIQPGTFTMGMGKSDIGPPHQVTLTKGFSMQTTEVTQGQWKAVMKNNPSFFKGDDCLPVEEVSWDDTQAFIGKLNQKGLGTYRLPTEAEWEYAERAGTTTAFPCGDSDSCLYQIGWFRYGENYKEDLGQTHPVGQKQPNPWGLYDMQGNVSEWIQDRGRKYTKDAISDPVGPGKGSRGCSWETANYVCVSAQRYVYQLSITKGNYGFRTVK